MPCFKGLTGPIATLTCVQLLFSRLNTKKISTNNLPTGCSITETSMEDTLNLRDILLSDWLCAARRSRPIAMRGDHNACTMLMSGLTVILPLFYPEQRQRTRQSHTTTTLLQTTDWFTPLDVRVERNGCCCSTTFPSYLGADLSFFCDFPKSELVQVDICKGRAQGNRFGLDTRSCGDYRSYP